MAAADANATPATGVTGTILLPRQQRLPGVISELRGDGTAMVSLAWGQAVSIKRSDMIRQAFRGGRLQWLSDLTPERVEETPFFDRVIHWRRDESLTGTTMQMGNRYYRKGVSQHSRSRLTYRLDGQYARFQSDVGLLLPGGADGNAAVRLLLDDVVAFELAEVAAGNSPNPQVIDLDLRGKQTLTLEVDFGKDYDVADHVGWGNAKPLKAKPE